MRSILLIALVLLMAPTTRATTLISTDLSEMSQEARAIALGRVVSIEPRWTADRRRIETLVTLEAESYLKGTLGTSVRFSVPGGQLGQLRQVVVGAPQFELGERVVVFLGARVPGIPFVLGFNQGIFRVTLDNGSWVVASPIVSGQTSLQSRGQGSRRSVPLGDFAREVRLLAVPRR